MGSAPPSTAPFDRHRHGHLADGVAFGRDPKLPSLLLTAFQPPGSRTPQPCAALIRIHHPSDPSRIRACIGLGEPGNRRGAYTGKATHSYAAAWRSATVGPPHRTRPPSVVTRHSRRALGRPGSRCRTLAQRDAGNQARPRCGRRRLVAPPRGSGRHLRQVPLPDVLCALSAERARHRARGPRDCGTTLRGVRHDPIRTQCPDGAAAPALTALYLDPRRSRMVPVRSSFMADAVALRTTPLHARHRTSGARMAPYAGWDMPVEYSGITDEHLAVRTRAGAVRRQPHGRDRGRRQGRAGGGAAHVLQRRRQAGGRPGPVLRRC